MFTGFNRYTQALEGIQQGACAAPPDLLIAIEADGLCTQGSNSQGQVEGGTGIAYIADLCCV
jgi:hypothetical protein